MTQPMYKRILSSLLIIFLTGCVSVNNQDEQQFVVPMYPVIFIHGLGYNGDYWSQSETLHQHLTRAGEIPRIRLNRWYGRY